MLCILLRIYTSKNDKYITLEAFLTAFVENRVLGEKVYEWLKSQSDSNHVDENTFLHSSIYEKGVFIKWRS